MTETDGQIRLIVFADDWGRHPSSCQHLIRELVPRHPTLWVNTIGMRQPGWSRADLKKAVQRLRQWTVPSRVADAAANLRIVTPVMWPEFRRPWQRALNRRLIVAAVNRALRTSVRGAAERRIVITTLPITAALVGWLDVDAWIYYCTDHYSAWPGLDADVLAEMERELIQRADCIIAVSPALQERLSSMGRHALLLPHGVDVGHWGWLSGNGQRSAPAASALPTWWSRLRRPIVLFWGLIGVQLDTEWVRALQDSVRGGTFVLVGPVEAHDPALDRIAGVVIPGAVAYESLPLLAAHADVLAMPYADLPLVSTIEPLKFKEYLATNKPVVVRRLPAMQSWEDAADTVDSAAEFVRAVADRLANGVPPAQLLARRRLLGETWRQRAEQLETVFVELLRATTGTGEHAPTRAC